MNDERNFLEEAIRIIRGQSLLQPELGHLQALNESRVYWRSASLGRQAAQVHDHTERRAS